MLAAFPLLSSVIITFCLPTFFFFSLTFIVFCLLWLSLLILNYDIQIGQPPIKGLFLAYKYTYFRRTSSFCFKQLYKNYPNCKLVKLCYCGPKSSHIEYANCVVVSEEGLIPDVHMLENVLQNGLTMFKTPNISHAISLCYPITPWISATKWLAIALAYPKLFHYVRENNLCAYPVLEIYSKYSVTIMVPLLRQDEFVVREAERLVHGHMYSALLSPLSTLALPITAGQKYSKVNSSSRVAKGERKG